MRYLTLLCIILSAYICLVTGYNLIQKKVNPDTFIASNIIDYLKTINKGVLTSSILTWEIKSKIKKIDTKEGTFKDPYNGKTHMYTLGLELEYQNRTLTFYFTKNYLKKAVLVYTPIGTEYKKSTIENLKVGDTILFQKSTSYNIMGGKSIESLTTKITKLTQ